MSPVKFLRKLIMFCLGLMLKTTIIAFPVSAVLIVMFIIFNDEFLSRHIILTLILTALFSFTCCLLTLSRICVLRRKSHAEKRTIGQLCDSDLMYENETEEVPFYKLSYHCKDVGNTLKNLIFRNPLEFSKFRPAYGMFLAFGLIFSYVFAAALMHVKEWNIKDEFYCLAQELIVPVVMMISVVYFIANTRYYIAEKESDLYVPFEEFIQVPMRIFVGKTVAVFVTAGITHCLLMVFLFSIIVLSITSSNYLYHTSEINEQLKNLLPPIYPDPRRFVSAVFVMIMVSCANVLIGIILSSFFQAKRSILGVIEKNWQRNLVAINFLLPNTEAETLKGLKDALDAKRNQPLTAKEIAAFNYIGWPIWRTKQPFMLRRFEGDTPEPESFDKQPPGVFEQVEPEHVQQPDYSPEAEHVAEHEQVELVHVDQSIQEVVHEMMETTSLTQFDETAVLEKSRSGGPSTSTQA